jgi:hypothetical protein
VANFWSKQNSSQFLKTNSILYTWNTTTQVSSTFTSQTRQIRVGTNITGGVYLVTADSTGVTVASTTGMFVAANNFPEYFTVNPGQVAAVNSTSTSSGVISCTEMG